MFLTGPSGIPFRRSYPAWPRTPVCFTVTVFCAIACPTSSSECSSRLAPAITNYLKISLPTVRFPHSRWNEVEENALTSCGYTILTKSIQAGVDVFVKQKRNSLFLHFQGHPEYGALTLMKEYRRDIRRYLKNERETYPSMPLGYFDTTSEKLLTEFHKSVVDDRREILIESFPEPALVAGLQKSWHSSAVGIYQNWLDYVVTKKAAISAFAALSSPYAQGGKRTAVL